MKRSVLNLLGGLLFCLPMVFTSCGNLDNPLEELVNQPNLEGLQKALYKNAEIKIQYTVADDDEVYTATLKNAGTVDEPKYEFVGEMPQLGYTLSCEMGYEAPYLHFMLNYQPENAVADEDSEAETALPVMNVRFDTETSKYDVCALPGFSFKVISINGADMEVTDASEGKKATIHFWHGSGETEEDVNLEMEVGLTGISTWEDLDKAFDEAGLGVFAPVSDKDGNDDDQEGRMVIDLSDYEDIYFSEEDAAYWHVYVIFDEAGTVPQKFNSEVATNTTYKARGYETMAALPVYGFNASGRDLVLLDVLFLKMPNEGTYTWQNIVAENSDLLKLVKTAAGKLTVVIQDNIVPDFGKGYYFGLYDGVSSLRVDATDEFNINADPTKDYHFYQLKKSVRETDTEYTQAPT